MQARLIQIRNKHTESLNEDDPTICRMLQQYVASIGRQLKFGEGVVNDATAAVLFNVIKNLDISQLKGGVVLKLISKFLSLLATSTIIGISFTFSSVTSDPVHATIIASTNHHCVFSPLWCSAFWPGLSLVLYSRVVEGTVQTP
ncbi:hypothetical protein U9M48_037741 [Paspalum notatum var. saurae]|uniref:Uncharacterized protein n=1 Tax=Paspalum notatum var. saurae TaxID=547442 RepID=A0AAQ3UGL8_PASNO